MVAVGGALVAAAIVLSYITLGGLSAAIYNEVLQFFVIVAALRRWRCSGCTGSAAGTASPSGSPGGRPAVRDGRAAAGVLARSGPDGLRLPFLSVVGIVFGLGFVLSFGYWTTNFVEVQRAMASDSMTAARKTPIIGAFPKMFVPFITSCPG